MADKEYIERENLQKAMGFVTNDTTCPIHIAAYIDQIVAQESAADVVEVRRGEWCLVEYEYLVCDKCGHWYYTGSESTAEAKEKLEKGETPNFCPNCGADMRGNKDDSRTEN